MFLKKKKKISLKSDLNNNILPSSLCPYVLGHLNSGLEKGGLDTLPTSVSLGGSREPQSVSVHFTKCVCPWPAGPVPAPGRVHRHSPIPCWLLSGPGAGTEVMEDAVLEASHSVQGYGCSWGSHSDQEAGPEGEGAWSPQTLHLKTERTR